MAGATATITWDEESAEILRAEISWLSDDTTGAVTYTFTEVDKARIRGKYLFFMVTNPGATAPSANYNITLIDDDGIDMAGGALLLRHTSTSEQAIPVLSSNASGDRVANGGLAVTIAAAGNAKIGVVKLWFRK